MHKSSTGAKAQALAFLVGVFVWAPASQLLAQDPPGVYKAPSAEPTPAETLVLEYINRSRANPTQDAALIAESGRIPKNVDQKMFADEMSQFSPAPPLVFDLSLIKAARWHSAYQIQHGQGHVQARGKAGFSGVGPGDRARAAGYQSRAIAENVFTKSRDPWYCHCGFVVDWGPGPGGMQPERGHRRNILNPRYRVAGVGALPNDTKLAVTQEFGNSRTRMVGGVVYRDTNRNRFYDLNEGVGGVSLSVDGTEMESWASGAYAMPISDGEQKIKVQIGETTFVSLLPEGNDNVKFDVFLSDAELYAKNTKLLEAVRKIPDEEGNEDKRTAALTNLYLATRDSMIEESIYDEVIELTRDAQEKLEAAMEDVRSVIAESDLTESKKRINSHAKIYRRTAANQWFADAKSCLSLVEAYQKLKKRADAGKPPTNETVQKALRSQQRVFERLSVPEWRTYGLDVGKQIQELVE